MLRVVVASSWGMAIACVLATNRDEHLKCPRALELGLSRDNGEVLLWEQVAKSSATDTCCLTWRPWSPCICNERINLDEC
jgi:hypothetical protein